MPGFWSLESVMNRVGGRLQATTQYKKIMSLRPYPSVQPFSKTKECRFIESIHNKHLGQEIWVLGCGPSLDDFPQDFFDDKLTIGANWSIIAFPNLTYWRGDANAWIFLRKYRPEIFRRTFMRFPLVNLDIDKRLMEGIFGEYQFDPIRIRRRPHPRGWEKFAQQATEAVNSALKDPASFAPPHHSSCIHQLIPTAALLGAKEITLAGCEHEPRDGLHHAQRGNLKYFYIRRKAHHNYPKLKHTTRFIAGLLRQHNIRVRRYFPGKGYVEV